MDDNARDLAIAREEGYLDVTVKGDSGVCAIMPLMFTYAIIAGVNPYGYEDRWCYHNYEDAKKAFEAWDGEGDPTGWHRHPATGRRVDPTTGEVHINF